MRGRSKSRFQLGILISFLLQPVWGASSPSLATQLANLEASSGGRLGISAINTENNQRIQYRAHERFPAGCTAKVIGVAAILKKSMKDGHFLEQKVMYTKKDLSNWTPITGKHLADGMTIAELSGAAISYSDNTAMSLLVKKLGGPQELNTFARSIGDNDFRQDHDWPEEAMSSPQSNEDSTTPAAMEKSLQKILLSDVLAPLQREKLLNWLKEEVTGYAGDTKKARIRGAVPKGWVVGDKTGTGFYYGTTNDIAIIWPPQCKPIIVAIYYSGYKKEAPKREDIIAKATKLVINAYAASDHCIKKATDL